MNRTRINLFFKKVAVLLLNSCRTFIQQLPYFSSPVRGTQERRPGPVILLLFKRDLAEGLVYFLARTEIDIDRFYLAGAEFLLGGRSFAGKSNRQGAELAQTNDFSLPQMFWDDLQ